MTHDHLPRCGRGRVGLSVLVGSLVLAGPTPGRAEGPPALDQPPIRALEGAPLIPRQAVVQPGEIAGPSGPQPGQRLRLFRIQPGFLSEPLGLPAEDDVPADPAGERVSIAFGNDNPYFDFRRRSDPGGVGFTRVNTQVLLFDSSATSFAIGLQAVTPSGLEQSGLPESRGSTVLTPALSLFHALDDNLAVQAFVGKHMPLMNRAAGPAAPDLEYGMALQSPLFTEGADQSRGLFLSVGAVGQLRPERASRSPTTWEVLPGLHYRMAENWWISGGVSVPLGPTRAEGSQQWQVTCWLQF